METHFALQPVSPAPWPPARSPVILGGAGTAWLLPGLPLQSPQQSPRDTPTLYLAPPVTPAPWRTGTHREHERGHGRQQLRVDHGEDGGQVALPGSHEEQPEDRGESGRPRPRDPGRWGAEGACAEDRAPCRGPWCPPRSQLARGPVTSSPPQGSREPTREPGRTQQLCHLWAGTCVISVSLECFDSYVITQSNKK